MTATAKAPRIKIAAFRDLVRSVQYRMDWLTGGTSEEFKRQDVAGSMAQVVGELRDAMPQVPARFADDLAEAERMIASASRLVARWNRAQGRPALQLV